MRNIINVGDEVKNVQDTIACVTEIVVGKYGLLIQGVLEDGGLFTVMAPWELPPVEKRIYGWYDFPAREWIELPSGAKIGVVTCLKSQPRTLDFYADKWERTIELMRSEELLNEDRP